jgi:O-antigen/teichoic acid export membrane protein
LVLNLGLNLALIPRLGINGAAIAWAATIVGVNVAAIVQVRVLIGLDPFGRASVLAAGLAVACFGLLGGVVRWLMGPTVPALLLASGAGLLVYLACLARLRTHLRLDEFLSALIRPRAEAEVVEGPPGFGEVELPDLPGGGP